MNNITGKLRDISQRTLMLGGPRQRGSEPGVSQRLVVSEQGKLTSLQEKTEVTNSRVRTRSSLSKAEYLDSAEESFLEKKANGDHAPWRH